MHPYTQFRWTLLIALLMWSPALLAMLTGNIDFLKGGLIFVFALILAYAGTSIIYGLISNYQNQVEARLRDEQRLEQLGNQESLNTPLEEADDVEVIEDADNQDDATRNLNRRSADNITNKPSNEIG